MHSSGAISGAVSQSAACSKRKFSLHSGSARTKMAAHLTHVFARTPRPAPHPAAHPPPQTLKRKCPNCSWKSGKENACTFVFSSFSSHFSRIALWKGEKFNSSRSTIFTWLQESFPFDFWLCVCVCVRACVHARECIFVCVCVRVWVAAQNIFLVFGSLLAWLSLGLDRGARYGVWGSSFGVQGSAFGPGEFLASCGLFLLIAGQLEMFELLEDYCRICPCRWAVKNLSFALTPITSGWTNSPTHLPTAHPPPMANPPYFICFSR